MSPENEGVFQLLKEVTFRRVLASSDLRNMAISGVSILSSPKDSMFCV
jgi:hypothetical protein